MEKLTITSIKRESKVSKSSGKPYTSLRIQTEEYKERWLSGFDGKETASWKEGDVVDADVTDTGQYLNFSVPKAPRGQNTPPAGVPSYNQDQLLRELRAISVKHDKTYEVVCDLMRKLLKAEVIKLEVPFPTQDDFDNYGK